MLEPFQLPFVQRALVEVLLLAVAAGALGCWIVLRGLSFTAHGAAAATFPGLVLAGGLGFAAPLGGFGAALLFALAVGRLAARGHSGHDVLTALVLVAALALGTVLASDVFHSSAGVETLLFGSLLAIGPDDVRLAAAVALLALLAARLLGPRWLLAGFDRDAAGALGVRAAAADVALLVLLALTAVAMLSAVGALLVTALLVVPAATARLLTTRLVAWQLATAAIAALEGVAGLWLAVKANAPPGATIAVLSGGVFVLVALARGLGAGRSARVGERALAAPSAAGAS